MGRLVAPRLLADSDVTDGFSCGSNALDFWLKEKARLASKVNTARVFVLADGTEVIGYFALAASSVLRDELPAIMQDNLPRHRIPLLLLARLAIDTRFQGQGLGGDLVKAALQKTLLVSHHVGVVALATNAKDENAQGFYSALGFRPAVGDESLMVFPIVKIS